MTDESVVELEWCCAWHRYFAEHADEILEETMKLIDSTTWHGIDDAVQAAAGERTEETA